MNLTRTAITRPIFIFMLMIGAIIMGGISYISMKKELNPDVSFGIVTILTTYPGAGPEEIAELVTKPIEEAVSGVNNLETVTSTSVEGSSIVTVQVAIGSNVDNTINDVRSKIDAIVGQLPSDAEKPIITKVDTGSTPILYMSLTSDKLSSRELRSEIDNKIKERFARISGVSEVGVQGGDVREIQVAVKRDQLLRYGIGLTDVQRAVAAATMNVPSGRIVQGDSEFSVRVPGEFKSATELENMYISVSDPKNPNPSAPGKLVRLGDIATVSDAIAERTAYSRLDGSDTIVVVLTKASDGNTVDVVHAAKSAIKQIENDYKDQGLKITITQDTSKQIESSLEDLNIALFFGIFLVALIVYVFLHNFRGTLIVAIAIPVCLFVTMIGLRLGGFTINNLSMLALSLAVAVLVDDAIVVLENIFRHLKMGEDPREAALNGRAEIGLAAIAITLADVVVFLPLAFISGIVGQFFKPLAIGYVIAVLVSLFVSFTITPMLASRWFRAGEDVEHAKGFFAVWFERMFGAFERAYGRALEWSLNHRWFVFISGNLALVAVIVALIGGGMPSERGALELGMRLVMASGVFGVLAVAFSYHTRLGRFKYSLITFVSCYAVAIPIAFLLVNLGRIPPVTSMVGVGSFVIGTVLVGVVGFVQNLLGKPLVKSRLPLYGLLFGLMFPVAAVSGYHLQQWKGEQLFKFSFFPEQDNGRVEVNIELPPGKSLAETQKVVEYVEQKIEGIPEIEYALATVGTQGVSAFQAGSSGANYAQVVVSLYDKEAFMDKIAFWHKVDHTKLRTRDDKAIAAEVLQKVGRFPGAEIKVGTGSAFGGGAPIQVSFASDDRALLLDTVSKIKRGLQSGAVPGIINPDISSNPGKPELRAESDRVRLADAGMSVADLGTALRVAYTGDTTAKYREGGREFDIRVMLDLEDRNNRDVLANVPVKFRQGEAIYASNVANLVTGSSTDKIERRNRAEEVRVTADILTGFAAGTVQQSLNDWMAKEKLVPEGVVIKPLGQAESQAREGGALMGAFLLGLILVYMVLASLYDNLLYPFIIQLSQPQAIVGALLALIITDKAFSLIGFIGVIALVGLVGKNAILVVDYTNTLRSRGRNRHDALVEAGPTRLRPIMMTSIALVLGLLPVAAAIGRGSEFRETIGITIIGGILLSTLLTLFVIPCSYTIFDDLSERISGLRNRKARKLATDAGIDMEATEVAPTEPAEK